MNKYYLFLFLLPLIALSSCASLRIEKRHYRDGFYVNVNTNHKQKASAETTGETQSFETTSANTGTTSPVEAPKTVEEIPQVSTPATVPAQQPEEKVVVAPVENTVAPETKKNNAPEVLSKQTAESGEQPQDSDVELILLVILAILLPPLAVFLAQGVTKWFWISLILCIFGGGVFFYPIIGGLWLIAVIIALFAVFGLI